MTSKPAPKAKVAASKYPNLEAAREQEREEHVRRAMAGGLTRKQAEKHVRDDHEGDT
jgi:hypothetical protein